MPILLTPFVYSNNFHGNTWEIDNIQLLASHLADVALGQSLHVQKIIQGAQFPTPIPTVGAKRGAINLLTVSGADPYHRDGWIFQVMSWLAAIKANPHDILRAPQMRHADKGFDGLSLKLNSHTGEIDAAIIFEDKATENPRKTIRSEVWPGLSSIEKGDKENVLVAELSTLLGSYGVSNAMEAISKIVWNESCHYRVSVTVQTIHSTEAGRKRLFSGFNEIVAGDTKRRQGETIKIPQMRLWMQHLADLAIADLEARNV